MSLRLGNINRASAIPSVHAQLDRFTAHLRAGNFYSKCGTQIEASNDEVWSAIRDGMNISPVFVADQLFSGIYGTVTSQGLLIPSFQGTGFFHQFLRRHFSDAVDYISEKLPKTFIGNTTSSFCPINIGNNCRLINCVDCYVEDDDGLSENPDYRVSREELEGASRNVELTNCANVFILKSSNIKLENCQNLIIVDSDGLDFNGEDGHLIYQGNEYPYETDFTNIENGPYADPYNLCAFEHTTWTNLALVQKDLGRSSVEFAGGLISTNPELAYRALSMLESEVRRQLSNGVLIEQAFPEALAKLTHDGVLDLNTLSLLEGPKEE